MKDFLTITAIFILSFMLAAATVSIGSQTAPPRPPASVPTQKVEPPAESTPTPKPFNLGRYSVENLV